DLVNIWDDPEGAAFVRSVARGYETVPTVSIGPEALVNPSFHALMAVASEHAPSLVPDDYEPPAPRTGWISRHLGR
ncbi:MAG: NrdH-redoxin, partial [Acidimicrobiia bacterium]